MLKMNSKKLSLLAVSVIMSASSFAATVPEYDCTAAETKLFVEQVTRKTFAPSPIITPSEFKMAYVEEVAAKAAKGDPNSSGCAAIFSDGKLSDEWQRVVEQLRGVDFNVSFSGVDGAMLQALLDKAKAMAMEEVHGAIKKIGEDICRTMSSDNLEKLLLDQVNKQYGMNARSLRVNDFASSVTDRSLSSADKNVLLLLSDDQLDSRISSEAKGEIRNMKKELWQGF